MAESFIGEIRMFGGNFAPLHWGFCNGQLIAVTQNSALFSLIGAAYGGDGRSSFGIPDMRGRIPVHHGTGPGLTPLNVGNKYGVEEVTLTTSQIPSHSHPLQASKDSASSDSPTGMVLGSLVSPDAIYTMTSSTSTGVMNENSVLNAGGTQSHSNMMGYQCVSFIISLAGSYPSRN
ncbi:phage tail protein [Hahella ganghwensis]|uniref:phage tail protein n=1 Tax=Hahella ganghwensis TaxID=286420 RepID=UPI000373498E|nr:tail fiber protein [Hahella ganghwensis]